MSCNLEHNSQEIARCIGIEFPVWDRFMAKLQDLKQHDEKTYRHCLRVGIYSYGLARLDHVDYEKLAYFGGTGHDRGKCMIDTDVINAKVWTPECSKAMHEHAREGFELWKDDFLFTGIVAGLHHYYYEGGYGIDPDTDIPSWVPKKTREMITEATKVVMVSDFFDAITTRKNDKGLVSDPDNLEQVAAVMEGRFPENLSRVWWLLTHKINERIE